MKLSQLLSGLTSAAAGGAHVITAASNVALIVGGLYLVDCRISARNPEAIDRCYFTALPLMGVGVAGKGGFSAGYNTFNPSLRRPEEEHPATGDSRRDASGRFTGKR